MTQAFNLSQLANFVNSSGQLDASTGLTNTSTITFPSGTLMLFQQTAAPTGWTKITTHNNKALRVVSGTASSGGSVAFTTAFAAGLSAGATTLSTAQLPSHNHPDPAWFDSNTFGNDRNCSDNGTYNTRSPQGQYSNVGGNANNNDGKQTYSFNSGNGDSHSHTLPSFDVAYVDLIIAVRN